MPKTPVRRNVKSDALPVLQLQYNMWDLDFPISYQHNGKLYRANRFAEARQFALANGYSGIYVPATLAVVRMPTRTNRS